MSSLNRWSDEETEKIHQMRSILADQLRLSPPYAEVVGDRKLLRFLRGHNHDVAKASEMMSQFLQWRMDTNADKIRADIVRGGKNHPNKFPNGKKFLTLIPQVIIAHDALDIHGSPMSLEQYNFSPSQIFKECTLDEYLEFVVYSLEYKSLVLEQLSEEREREWLQTRTDSTSEKGGSDKDPLNYGVILNMCIVRDLNGVGKIFKSSSSLANNVHMSFTGVVRMIFFPFFSHESAYDFFHLVRSYRFQITH